MWFRTSLPAVLLVCLWATHVASQSTRSKWDGPYDMSIIPVAADNLPDGRILTWSSKARTSGNGGRNPKSPGQTYTAIFDPRNNRSTERFIKNTNHDMFCPGTAVLPDGRIAITGGAQAKTLILYDPKRNRWTRGADMKIPRGYQAMTMLGDGTVFTLGGSWSGGTGGKDGEIWNPRNNSWRKLNNVKARGTLLTNDSRGVYRSDNHMWLFTAPNGKVFHAGPSKQTHWITTGGNGSVRRSVRRDTVDAMNGNAVMYDIGKILTVGGAANYDSGNAHNRAHVFDLNRGDNVRVKRVGSMSNPRSFANAVALPNGEVIVVGGQSKVRTFSDSNAVLSAEIWNPRTEKFRTVASMKVPRTYHSVALLMKDGRVWAGGGGLCNRCSANHLDSEILTPPYLLDSRGRPARRPIMRWATSTVRAGSILKLRMVHNEAHTFAMVRLSAVTHSLSNDGRRFPLRQHSRRGTLFNLHIPRNRNIALSGSYFLFAMNRAGVPSVARVIRINP